MAYKFQLGDSKLGGSIVLGGDATLSGSLAGSDVDDATAANIVAEIDDKEIPHTKVALEDGDVLIGDNSGVAQNQTISGDATLASNGALTIAANAVSNGKLAGMTRGTVKVGNASGAASDLDAKTAGRILVGDGSDVASVAVSGDATLASNGALSLAADCVDSNEIADGAIDTAHIADDQVTYAKIQDVSATNRILGRDSAGAGVIEEITPANLRTMINVEDGATGDQTAAEIFALLNSDAGGNFTIGTQSDDVATFSGGLTVAGDLTVNGTTTTLNVTNLEVEDNNILIRSGSAAADGSGITIGTSGTPVTLQMADSAANLACSVPLKASSFIGVASSATILANARTIGGVSFDGSANINLPGVNAAGNQDTSGTAAVATTVTLADESTDTTCFVAFGTAATGDQGLKTGTNLTFNSANGTLTATAFSGDGSDLVGLPAGNPTISAKTVNGAGAGVALSLGVNVLTLGSDAHHVFRLPSSAANGDRIWIKNPSNASAARTANITGSLANNNVVTVEGASSIRLESPGSAVCLVYVGSNSWVVF